MKLLKHRFDARVKANQALPFTPVGTAVASKEVEVSSCRRLELIQGVLELAAAEGAQEIFGCLISYAGRREDAVKGRNACSERVQKSIIQVKQHG
jgi:hypothetical protein